MTPRGRQPTFYYDLGSPACYLAAERVMAELPMAPEWEPVWWEPDAAVDRVSVDAAAAGLGLQPVRWPAPWPPDTRTAMLAATFAKRIGRGVAFSLAAFRQAFAGGRDLGDADTLLIAGAACEMHPTALLKGIQMRSVAAALEATTGRAGRVGVRVLPAVAVGRLVFEGSRAVEEASAALSASAAAGP